MQATPSTLYRMLLALAYSPAQSIEVAVEEEMFEVEISGAIEEVVEETVTESNAIVDAINGAIEEHRVDIEAIEEALL